MAWHTAQVPTEHTSIPKPAQKEQLPAKLLAFSSKATRRIPEQGGRFMHPSENRSIITTTSPLTLSGSNGIAQRHRMSINCCNGPWREEMRSSLWMRCSKRPGFLFWHFLVSNQEEIAKGNVSMPTVIHKVSHQQMETRTNWEFYAESGARGAPKIHKKAKAPISPP